MNFEPITLFDLKPISATGEPMKRIGHNIECLTIRKGLVTLSKPLYERLGKPAWAEVCIDRRKKMLGVRKVDEQNVNRFKVEAYEYGGTVLKAAGLIPQTICEVVSLDLAANNYHALPASTYGEFVVFDLEKLIPAPIGKRAKKEA